MTGCWHNSYQSHPQFSPSPPQNWFVGPCFLRVDFPTFVSACKRLPLFPCSWYFSFWIFRLHQCVQFWSRCHAYIERSLFANLFLGSYNMLSVLAQLLFCWSLSTELPSVSLYSTLSFDFHDSSCLLSTVKQSSCGRGLAGKFPAAEAFTKANWSREVQGVRATKASACRLPVFWWMNCFLWPFNI